MVLVVKKVSGKEGKNERLSSAAEAGLFQDKPEEDTGQKERELVLLLSGLGFSRTVQVVFGMVVLGAGVCELRLMWVC
jgi:hypothetical protein